MIDSAARWNANGRTSNSIGHGVVPKRIEDVLSTNDDEIKFFITGITEDYVQNQIDIYTMAEEEVEFE